MESLSRRVDWQRSAYLQWHCATRVNRAESCDNLSPLGSVAAVAVYQAYQRAQNALKRVHPAETWRQLASCKILAIWYGEPCDVTSLSLSLDTQPHTPSSRIGARRSPQKRKTYASPGAAAAAAPQTRASSGLMRRPWSMTE